MKENLKKINQQQKRKLLMRIEKKTPRLDSVSSPPVRPPVTAVKFQSTRSARIRKYGCCNRAIFISKYLTVIGKQAHKQFRK
jgi:hypothetical protein